jgi:hypothetical protein
MSDIKPPPGPPPQGTPAAKPFGTPARPPAQGSKAAAPAPAKPPAESSGRVVHDARGNAVWDWVKNTGREALDGTTRILRRLETPELKVEDTQESKLRIEGDGEPGGGYDPYDQKTPPRKPGGK